MSETLRILVVDDDPSMAKTLVDIFKVKGHQAEAAHSGPEALAKVAQGSFGSAHRHEYSRWQDRHFDCVLTDVKMPGVNGVELYRALKARQPDLPVVLMTAYSTDRLVEEGLGEGAIAVLTKPLDTAAGGVAHGGGNLFATTADANYRKILQWLEEGEAP